MLIHDIKVHRKSFTDKDGFCRLHFFVSINGEPGWFPTGLKCERAFWDEKKQKVKSGHIDWKEINAKITKKKGAMVKVFEALEYENLVPTVELVRQRWNKVLKHDDANAGKKQALKEYTVQEYMQMYVEDRRNVCSNGYLRNFKQTIFWLDEVQKKLKFSDITQQFYLDFVNKMIEDGELENNTMYGHIKRLISVMGAALIDPRTRHLNIPIDFKLFSDMYVKPKVYWLDWETEVACLENFEPLPEDRDFLDFFLFLCYTGLRHSDAFAIKPENFIKNKNGVFLDITIIKTKLDHNIQLNDKAVAILKKWNYRVPRIYQHDLNAKIKSIAAAAGEKSRKGKRESGLLDLIEKVRYRGADRVVSMLHKYELITTHTGRRTFGRRWAEMGGEIRYLSKYYGHATVAQTEEYIGWSTVEVNAEMMRVFGSA